jgi:hypothetical protein
MTQRAIDRIRPAPRGHGLLATTSNCRGLSGLDQSLSSMPGEPGSSECCWWRGYVDSKAVSRRSNKLGAVAVELLDLGEDGGGGHRPAPGLASA